MTTKTTEPLSADQLRAFRECLSDAMHRDGELYLTTDAPHDMLSLLDEVDRLRALLATVHRFVDGRCEVITAIRNCPADDPNGDYGRWTGDAQARRVLAEDLGIELDHETGGIRRDTEDLTVLAGGR